MEEAPVNNEAEEEIIVDEFVSSEAANLLGDRGNIKYSEELESTGNSLLALLL